MKNNRGEPGVKKSPEHRSAISAGLRARKAAMFVDTFAAGYAHAIALLEQHLREIQSGQN